MNGFSTKLAVLPWWLTAALGSSFGVSLHAEDQATDPKGSFNVLIENDVFAATDRHYTNGLQFGYLTAPRTADGVASTMAGWLPGNGDGEVRVGWQLGQTIFTPEDTDAVALLPDERPYAGWLYLSASIVYSSDTHIDTWALTFGTIGPDAQGEELQNGFHDLINSDESRGWDNQLGNELGGTLNIERKWRSVAQTQVLRFGVDFMPHIGIAAGNIETYANAGFTVRVGTDLENDFGAPRIRPSLPGSGYFVPRDGWAWYLFAGVDGRYVERNIFLDDADEAELWNISKKRWVADLQAGVALTGRRLRLTYTYVYRTEEFDLQQDADRFGSVALTWRF